MATTTDRRVRTQVRRLSVWAAPDDTDLPVAEARRRARDGDDEWQAWLTRLDRGEAAVVCLRTAAEFVAGDRPGRVDVVNHGVWIELDVHPPKVEEQVRELAYKDVGPLTALMREQGAHVHQRDLEDMFFHVDLSPELAAAAEGG